MDTPKKVLVGYDLCDEYTQICCYSYKTHEAILINAQDGNEDGLIPTVLCYKSDTRQWLFGDEAYIGAKNGVGILVDNILTKLKNNEEIDIQGVKYSAQAIIEKYLRKTLILVRDYFPTQPITKLVLTIRNSEPELTDKLYDSLALLGIEKGRAIIINHEDAYLYYALYQDRSLWMNDVGLFDYNTDGLAYYQIRINRWTKPMIASLEKNDFTDSLEYKLLQQKNADAAFIFENLANAVLYKQVVSTLYFTGKGFQDSWAAKVMKSLCTGRRVFYGQNLFTKGACYAAKELSGDKRLQDILLLNDDMVVCNVALRVYKDTKFTEVKLMEVGELWYKAGISYELIPDGTAELEIIQRDLMSRKTISQRITLDQFPIRLDRTSRIKIEFYCSDKFTGVIRVTDLGFGDFYNGTGRKAEFKIKLTVGNDTLQWSGDVTGSDNMVNIAGNNTSYIGHMGNIGRKLILCSGARAKKPYCFSSSGIRIYSIEELCYYLFNYIYMIDEITFNDELYDWIETELILSDRADKLRVLKRQKADLKTIITVILCSADYYTESEIKSILKQLDDILRKPVIERRCIKAASLLKNGNYKEAAKEYEIIIHSSEASELSPEKYGDIFHNLGVAKAHITGVKEASHLFLEAYKRNNNDESLKQYLYTLLLMGDMTEFENKAGQFQVSESIQEYLKEFIRSKECEAVETEEYKTVAQLSKLKKGANNKFTKKVEEIINDWKAQYSKA